jgi:DNA mismatch endonuclease (patch repair protein)
MADIFSKKQRSYVMSRIRSSHTQPELKLRRFLKSLGFVYQPKGIYGSPDFANRERKIAVFIDGCFWHGCKKHFRMPKSNIEFWSRKINGNVRRDKRQTVILRKQGWKVVRIWEHKLREGPDMAIQRVKGAMKRGKHFKSRRSNDKV